MDTRPLEKRPGATHAEAVRNRFPGVVRDVSWQDEDQMTITVAIDSLPDVVEYLYFGRGGFLPMMVGNDERPLTGNYALYYILSCLLYTSDAADEL